MGERQGKNVPKTLSSRKIKMPKESMKRSGVILPKREKEWSPISISRIVQR
jgi:hypothetical protein